MEKSQAKTTFSKIGPLSLLAIDNFQDFNLALLTRLNY